MVYVTKEISDRLVIFSLTCHGYNFIKKLEVSDVEMEGSRGLLIIDVYLSTQSHAYFHILSHPQFLHKRISLGKHQAKGNC